MHWHWQNHTYFSVPCVYKVLLFATAPSLGESRPHHNKERYKVRKTGWTGVSFIWSVCSLSGLIAHIVLPSHVPCTLSAPSPSAWAPSAGLCLCVCQCAAKLGQWVQLKSHAQLWVWKQAFVQGFIHAPWRNIKLESLHKKGHCRVRSNGCILYV